MDNENKNSPNRGGRPTKRTTDTEKRLLDGIADGLPHRTACGLALISEDTLALWRKDPEFEKAFQLAEACSISNNVGVIREASRDDWRAASWLLERRHPEMFGTPQHQVQLHQINVQNNLHWGRQECMMDPHNLAIIKALVNRDPIELPDDQQD